MENFVFRVLGTRGSRPVSGKEFQEFGGATSCYLLRRGDYALVLDCGTGLYEAKEHLTGCTRVDVAVTHLHYDHILGLLGWGIFPPKAQVRLLTGRIGGTRLESPAEFIRPPYWPVRPQFEKSLQVPCGEAMELTHGVKILFVPANHPDGATVLRVDTQEGSMCLICDWEHGERPVPQDLIQGCSFAVYDGMYTEEEYPAHRGWGHSTWQEGVKLVQTHRIPKLFITHHLPEHDDAMLRSMEENLRNACGESRFLRVGDVFTMEGVLINGH